MNFALVLVLAGSLTGSTFRFEAPVSHFTPYFSWSPFGVIPDSYESRTLGRWTLTRQEEMQQAAPVFRAFVDPADAVLIFRCSREYGLNHKVLDIDRGYLADIDGDITIYGHPFIEILEDDINRSQFLLDVLADARGISFLVNSKDGRRVMSFDVSGAREVSGYFHENCRY